MKVIRSKRFARALRREYDIGTFYSELKASEVRMRFSDVKMERPYPAPGTEARHLLQIKYGAGERLTINAKELAEDLYHNEQSPAHQPPVVDRWLGEEIYRKDCITRYQPHDPAPWRYPAVARNVTED